MSKPFWLTRGVMFGTNTRGSNPNCSATLATPAAGRPLGHPPRDRLGQLLGRAPSPPATIPTPRTTCGTPAVATCPSRHAAWSQWQQINKMKLYVPGRGDQFAYPLLGPALPRPIRWDTIKNNHTSSLKPEVLAERLMLAIFGYGTSTGIRAVAFGGHAHSEDDIRYVRRRYLTPQIAQDIAIAIANATFTARDVALITLVDCAQPCSVEVPTWENSLVAVVPSRVGSLDASDVRRPSWSREPTRRCSHRGKTWKRMRCVREAGRSRRSPGIWAGIAGPFARI